MPAGHDDGSPAKLYADNYRKARAEVVAKFKQMIKDDNEQWPWGEYEPGLQDMMDQYGLTIDTLIQ